MNKNKRQNKSIFLGNKIVRGILQQEIIEQRKMGMQARSKTWDRLKSHRQQRQAFRQSFKIENA